VDAELLAAAATAVLATLGAALLGLILAEALGRLNDRARRKRLLADERARALLREWLSPAQIAQYDRDGHFEVTGCHSGRRYRIRAAQNMNIDQLDASGVRTGVWCVGPAAYLPVADIMLTQKLALETDERAALAVANWHPVHARAEAFTLGWEPMAAEGARRRPRGASDARAESPGLR